MKNLFFSLPLLLLAWWLYVPPPPSPTFQPPAAARLEQQVSQERYTRRLAQETVVARRVFKRNHCRPDYAELVARYALENGLSTRVLAGLIFVESSCRPGAVSKSHCYGLTQVSPRTWKYPVRDLLNPELNVQIGAKILAGYVHRYGLREGLHAYNGFGDPTDGYARKVLTAAGYQV